MASPVIISRARLLCLCLAALPASLSAQTAAPTTAQRIVIEGTARPLTDSKITDLDGRDITAAMTPRADAHGVSVAAGTGAFVLKPRTIATVSLGEDSTALPGELILTNAAEPQSPEPVSRATAPGEEAPSKTAKAPQEPKQRLRGTRDQALQLETVARAAPTTAPAPTPPPTPSTLAPSAISAPTATVLRLMISASPRPAIWDEATGHYITQLKFSVLPADRSLPASKLPQPIEVSLDFEGMTGPAIAPFTIDETGLTHEKKVQLQFQPVSAEPILCIRSSMTDANVRMEALPRLVLTNTQPDVLGFGLETFTVTVEHQGPQGNPEAVATATPVTVTVNGAARLLGDTVSIPAGQSRADIKLRSGGLVPLLVTASIGNRKATAPVRQHFPYGPLVAALLGGLLGGFARRWVKGARRNGNSRHLAEGAGVALIAFIAAVLGVGYLDLPEAIAATEAGAFLTGALCGFAGVVVLSKLSRTKAEPAG